MPYNTVAIKKDVDGKPVPQYFNPVSNQYEALEGNNGSNKVELYNSAGQPIDLATLIANIITAINTTGTTQLRPGTNSIGKVEVTSTSLPPGASTSAKQDQMITALANVIAEIAKPVKLNGSTMEYFGKANETKPTSNVIKGATFFEIDTLKVFMYDGSTWVVI